MKANRNSLIIFTFLALSLSGCARDRVLATTASTSTPATLPVGVYPLYCIKIGTENRARVLSVSPKNADGWPTKNDVTLKVGTLPIVSACPNKGSVATGDTLKVTGAGSGPFTLVFTHTDLSGTKKTETLALDPPPNLPAGIFPMWYQTSGDASNHENQYFVYFADANDTIPGQKIQKYTIEAFSLSATPACLLERPDFASKNIEAVASATDCYVPGFRENGTGTGDEPK